MWFLQKEIYEKIDAAIKDGFQLTAETIVELKAASRSNGKLTVNGRTAVIPIEGVLTEKPDFFAAFFGGGNTTYPSIRDAVAQANADSSIDDIVLRFGSSPGGNMTGMFQTIDAIDASEKSVRAFVENQATSAAYGLASQAETIVALNRATVFGSIGAAVDLPVKSDVISLASTEAPEKRPDLTTDKGKESIQKHLDAMHELFATAIAIGRDTDVESVNKNYGRGAVVLADAALRAGMIDSIGAEDQTQTKTANGGKIGGKSMDLKTLMRDHPDLYAAVVDLGVQEERDRVQAHLKLGEASGAMDTAIKAIQDGSGLTLSLTAEYQAAGIKKNAMDARTGDNPDIGKIDAPSTRDTFGEAVLKELNFDDVTEDLEV
jgi:ClpP class serine protease